MGVIARRRCGPCRDHRRGGVIARLRQGSKLLPIVGQRVVRLMRRDRRSIGRASADGMSSPVECNHCDRTAARLQRSQNAPGIERGIVFKGGVLPVFVNAPADEAADGIDFPFKTAVPI